MVVQRTSIVWCLKRKKTVCTKFLPTEMETNQLGPSLEMYTSGII